MESRKNKIAAAMALCMAAVMTGCSGSVYSSEDKTTSDDGAYMASGVDEAAKDNNSSSAEERGSEYSYYNELAAEWEKTGDTSARAISYLLSPVLREGKIIFTVGEGLESTALYCYDVNTKRLTKNTINIANDMDSAFYYANGYVYYSREGGYAPPCVIKYDLDGNEVASVGDVHMWHSGYIGDGYDMAVISDTGYVYLGLDADNGYAYLTPDFQIVEMPSPKAMDSHGLETYVNGFTVIGAYGSKFYAAVDTGGFRCSLCCFNTETKEWSTVISDMRFREFSKTVGKYLITQHDGVGLIYNMETDEILADNLGPIDRRAGETFMRTYHGGTQNIVRNGDVFLSVRVGTDGSETGYEEAAMLGIETAYDVTMLDDTYYVLFNGTELFLRTYEKGETEDTDIIYLFNN